MSGYEIYRRIAFALEVASFVTVAVCAVILTLDFHVTAAAEVVTPWDAWFAWLDTVRLDPQVPFADFDPPDEPAESDGDAA